MRIGILTSGGDCPGINATIRGVCKTAINYYGMEVVGIHSGFQGLLTKDVESITDKSLSGLLNLGGTMLGTSREKPFKKGGVVSDVDKPSLILQNIREMELDCVVCIGGNGTQKTAAKFAAMGVNIVSVPKTIDNDIWGTDISFGFDSAVSIATDAIDRLHSTASSHKRVMVIEVMGHKAGWIALYSGMAGGGDVILLPEIAYDIKNIGNTILERLKNAASPRADPRRARRQSRGPVRPPLCRTVHSEGDVRHRQFDHDERWRRPSPRERGRGHKPRLGTPRQTQLRCQRSLTALRLRSAVL